MMDARVKPAHDEGCAASCPGRDCGWRISSAAPTLPLRGCVARQEPYIPGALSILPGTVPGQVRGPGHMVPTYFRRELRDRVLQRRPRLRALFNAGIETAVKAAS